DRSSPAIPSLLKKACIRCSVSSRTCPGPRSDPESTVNRSAARFYTGRRESRHAFIRLSRSPPAPPRSELPHEHHLRSTRIVPQGQALPGELEVGGRGEGRQERLLVRTGRLRRAGSTGSGKLAKRD